MLRIASSVLMYLGIIGFSLVVGLSAISASTASAASVSNWWPVNNAEINGTQPFKALIDGMPVQDYQMYWSVDNGQLNHMHNDYTDYPHKEASVNLDGWNWRGAGPYEVTFIAKNNNGDELARKSIKIKTDAQEVSENNSNNSENNGSENEEEPVHNPEPTEPPVEPNPNQNQNQTPPTTNNPIPSIPSQNGNPLSSFSFFVDPNNPARNQAEQWRSSRPADAAQMDKLASQPGARWFGNWNSSIRNDVDAYVDAAASQNQVPVMIAYNIPQRDCGHYSAGGVGSPEAYKSWIRSFAEGIGSRKAVVILEPDALALTSCLSSADLTIRHNLIKDAIDVFKSNSNTKVYLDAGHSNWLGASDMAGRLQSAGIIEADGFALNTSNFELTNNLVSYGSTISGLTGGKHFVIDTSRNGLGSNGQWCNPEGRALGAKVTTQTGNPLVDAFLWLKVPGESDGSCNGAPSAGVWWPEYALGLAQRAAY